MKSLVAFVGDCAYTEETRQQIERRLGMKLRMIDEIIDERPLITDELYEMALWMKETTLSPGTILFLYTDGLTEATRSDGELFQEERVQAQLSGHDENTSAERLVADMTAAVDRFIGDAEQSDDLTMLVLKMLRKSRD